MGSKLGRAALMLVMVSGCSGSEEGNSPIQGNQTSATPAESRDWNAADACALVDEGIVAQAAGSDVTQASLSGASQGGEAVAALSTCTYSLAGGGSISVLTRRSPIADFSPQAVEQARTMGGMMQPAVDVPGLGQAALWTSQVNTLQLFIDDSRYATINLVGVKGDTKAIATAIASKIE
jgi:hypothetical protein